jgi:hypothetical protein
MAVFKIVVVMLEGALGVVRRIDVDAFHTTGVEREQCLEGFEIVALDRRLFEAGSPTCSTGSRSR